MKTRNLIQHLLIVSAIVLVAAASARAATVVTLEATPGTTIELEAGTYYLDRVVLAENFRGKFRGAGKDQTIVTSVGELEVSTHDPPWFYPPSLDNPWMAFFTFLDGDFTLKDMTFLITEEVPMTLYIFGGVYEAMHSIVLVAGGGSEGQVRSSIRNVGFEGAAGLFGGTNIINGLSHLGILADTPAARGVPLTGRHHVTNCSYANMYDAIFVYHMTGDASLVHRNGTYQDVVAALTLQDTGGRIVFAGNEVHVDESAFGGDARGLLIDQGIWTFFDGVDPVAPALLTVCYNDFHVTSGPEAISLIDWQQGYANLPPSLFVTMHNNDIVTDSVVGGIYGYALTCPIAMRNDIQGTFDDAGIRLELTANGWFILNDVRDVEAGTAPFVLAADTHDNLVVAVDAWDDVLDLTDDPETPEYDGANTIISVGSAGSGSDD
jgi:hypothetical protein